MEAITKDMSVKEARLWISEKRKRINTMPIDELNEFNQELALIDEEQSKRWYNRLIETVSNIWYGLLTAAFVLASIVYGPWLP